MCCAPTKRSGINAQTLTKPQQPQDHRVARRIQNPRATRKVRQYRKTRKPRNLPLFSDLKGVQNRVTLTPALRASPLPATLAKPRCKARGKHRRIQAIAGTRQNSEQHLVSVCSEAGTMPDTPDSSGFSSPSPPQRSVAGRGGRGVRGKNIANSLLISLFVSL